MTKYTIDTTTSNTHYIIYGLVLPIRISKKCNTLEQVKKLVQEQDKKNEKIEIKII